MRFKLLVAFFVLAVPTPLVCQVQPDVAGGRSSISVGGGFSTYDVDLGNARMAGETFWSDWQPNLSLTALRGIGVELEVRNISLGSSPNPPSVYRMDTYGGGAIYTVDHFRNFRPYGKFLLSIGSIDWSNPNTLFKHETRSVYSPGFGIDSRIYNRLWLRADYEYQFWSNIDAGPHGDTINPQGFNFGVSYQLGRQHAR